MEAGGETTLESSSSAQGPLLGIGLGNARSAGKTLKNYVRVLR